MDFKEHDNVLKARKTAQEVECDRRNVMRDCINFVSVAGGQWDKDVWDKFATYDRPRITLDRCRPLLKKVWGEIADQEIQVDIKPAGGKANKETAKTICGLYRNIEYQSGAADIYATNARRFMVSGFDAIMAEQDWADNDSMDQELFIRPITDAVNRVWFLGNWTSPTGADAPAVTLDHMMDADEFEEKFGKDGQRGCESLDTDSDKNFYYHKRQGKIVSQLFYKQSITKELIEGPNGEIIDAEDEQSLKAFKELKYDLKGARRRKRDTFKIMSRYYDAQGWLNEPEETVFDLLPIVMSLPDFDITENKPISVGFIEPLMDPQKMLNYGVSKQLGDTALAPKPKIWATKEHLVGYESKLKSYNDNKDPVFIYNNVTDAPPPFQMGATGVDPSLINLVDMASRGIEESAGVFGPSMGQQMGNQSGAAIDKLQHKGDVGSLDSHKTMVRTAEQIARVIVRALPRVYSTTMTKRIIGEDGDYESVEINKTIMTETGPVVMNDLTKGSYDVYCAIGPAYKSRRTETSDKLLALGGIDPSIIMQNKDILLGSIDSPGMDMAAERARTELIKAGQIPESQLSDEEKKEIAEQQAQAAANPPPPDPMQIVAEAQAQEAQASVAKAQTEAQTALIKAQQAQQKMDFEQEKQKLELMAKSQKDMVDMLNTMADTLNKIAQSTGAQTIVSPAAMGAYEETAQDIARADVTL